MPRRRIGRRPFALPEKSHNARPNCPSVGYIWPIRCTNCVVMPTSGLCRAGRTHAWNAGLSGAAMRHNQRASRKASNLSSG